MKILTALGILTLALSGLAGAQDPAPDAVFAEVSRDLNTYKTLEYAYELKDGEEPFQVTAWFDDGAFRRVKASQKGDGGVLTRDFYYNNEGELRFAIANLVNDEKPADRIEERFDFKDDKLVSYIGADGKPVPAADKAFFEMQTALIAMSTDVMQRVEGSTAYVGMIGANEAPKAAAGTVFGAGYSDGVFSGGEQADYFHLDLEQADGEIATFFVIKSDASIEPFVKDPEASKGKKIRVHWVEKMQEIPEADDVARLKICERIELLK